MRTEVIEENSGGGMAVIGIVIALVIVGIIIAGVVYMKHKKNNAEEIEMKE